MRTKVSSIVIILVPIALFAPHSRQGLGTRMEGPYDSRAKALPAKRSEKGYGDENVTVAVMSCVADMSSDVM